MCIGAHQCEHEVGLPREKPGEEMCKHQKRAVYNSVPSLEGIKCVKESSNVEIAWVFLTHFQAATVQLC